MSGYTVSIEPTSPQELAQALADAASSRRTIALGGNSTKIGMAGPAATSDVTISTRRINQVLKYDPRDLTISVGAGLRYGQLSQVLAEHGQMIPLDPAFSDEATVGGILSANMSGPRRRLYGTARDMVIGMTFATLEGKLVQTGGMVVKNVAGLDMGKLMIGSFGTLAAIAVVNFKVHPVPPATRTFVQRFTGVAEAITTRNDVLKSVLQPAAIDLQKVDGGYRLLMQAGGSPRVLDAYSQKIPGADVLEGEAESSLWRSIREFTPTFLNQHADGAVVRIPCALQDVGKVLERLPGSALARAGSGVVYGYFSAAQDAIGQGLIEFAPQRFRETHADLWPDPGDSFDMMKKIKQMLDPACLLNRGRLYGRI